VNPRRLYRCRDDRQLAGVAAGMAEYLDMDPTVVRILWILSAFLGGFSILLYIILAFVIPLEPLPVTGATPASDGGGAPTADTGDPATVSWTAPVAHEHRARGESRIGFGVGIVLVVFGAIALTGPLFPGWVAGVALGPAFLVALGVALVIVATRRPAASS
jgi:phage shock protein PspC (stress-responsive transcriptional regulator)